MFVKSIIIFFLNLLMINKVLSYEVIPKYGSKKVNDNYVFLDSSDFSNGDKIYISITHYSYITHNTALYYAFYDTIDDKTSFSANEFVKEGSTSSVQSFGSYEETFNYKIEKKVNNGNYLYLEYSFTPPVFVENTKKDKTTTTIIIVVVCIVVFFAFFITVICCICKRRRAALAAGALYPQSIGYGVSPYVVAPGSYMQPVMNIQPIGANYLPNSNYDYNQNAQYNRNVQIDQVVPTSKGSEHRIKQDLIYQKPK